LNRTSKRRADLRALVVIPSAVRISALTAAVGVLLGQHLVDLRLGLFGARDRPLLLRSWATSIFGRIEHAAHGLLVLLSTPVESLTVSAG
jgi:hypothetical protein